MPGKTRGRQKTKMEKISKESNRQRTFSKRRAGLFKKASELSTLCGAETTIIAFSPGRKVFSFGHPSVETVIDRYISGNPPSTSGSFQLTEAHRNARIDQLNQQLNQITNELEMEKMRRAELDQISKASQTHCWWEAPIEELNLSQLEMLKVALEDLKSKVAQQTEQLPSPSSNPPQLPNPSSNPPQCFTADSFGGVPGVHVLQDITVSDLRAVENLMVVTMLLAPQLQLNFVFLFYGSLFTLTDTRT